MTTGSAGWSRQRPLLGTGIICIMVNVPFRPLAWVEGELRNDRLLAPHYRYYVRQIRILAYSQLLESYRSLTLDYMAQAFGVSPAFMDKYVHLPSLEPIHTRGNW